MKEKVLLAVVGAGAESWGCTRWFQLLHWGGNGIF